MVANGVAQDTPANGHHDEGSLHGTFRVKAGLAQMLKGGVIMGKLKPGGALHVMFLRGLIFICSGPADLVRKMLYACELLFPFTMI